MSFFSPMNNPVIKHMRVHVYIERIVKAGGYRAVVSLAPRVLVGRESYIAQWSQNWQLKSGPLGFVPSDRVFRFPLYSHLTAEHTYNRS